MQIFSVNWLEYAYALADGALTTLRYTVVSFVGAVIIGLFLALLRQSASGPARLFARSYVELFKNIPLLTPIFVIYFGLASIGIVIPAFASGAIALTVFYAAYMSEIFRGALLGVPPEQREAAQALGMTNLQILYRVTLPQAFRLALPGTGMMLVDVLKATSLLVTIAAGELMMQAQIISSITYEALEVYVGIGVIYFVMCFSISHLVLNLEQKVLAGEPLSPRRVRLHRRVRDLMKMREGESNE